jgi:hypothetical protein
VKKRWKVAIGFGVAAALFVLVPITYIEAGCRGGADDGAARPYRSLAGMGRPEARTWLTYPEWHVVYAADALGAWLTAGKPPSGYPYLSDARAFWSSYCRLNRIVDGREGSGSARVMLHTIGVSFTAEMLVKSVYENTIGRLSESLGGWASPADRHAARVQQDYGSFMHEVPWYAYPFGKAASSRTTSSPIASISRNTLRHTGRRRRAADRNFVLTGCSAGSGSAECRADRCVHPHRRPASWHCRGRSRTCARTACRRPDARPRPAPARLRP